MGYSKLHSSLVNSSLWCERDDVRILFITMLALANRDGHVYGSRAGIFRQANITFSDDKKDPFDQLMDEDLDSSDLLRNPENQGRRIREIPGGFEIINYPYYRGLRNDDDRREQNRIAQERFRNKHKEPKPKSAKVSRHNPRSSHAEAEAISKEQKAKASTEEEIITYCRSLGLPDSDGQSLWLKWQENGWKNDGRPIKDWKLTIQRWKLDGILPSQRSKSHSPHLHDVSKSYWQSLSPQARNKRINQLNEKKQKTNRMIKDPLNPPSWAEKELAKIDEELKTL